jgi:hypothetical protein
MQGGGDELACIELSFAAVRSSDHSGHIAVLSVENNFIIRCQIGLRKTTIKEHAKRMTASCTAYLPLPWQISRMRIRAVNYGNREHVEITASKHLL